MTAVGTLAPGADLPALARELSGIHSAVLEGRSPRAQPRAVVSRSWERVMALGLSADGSPRRDPLPAEIVEQRRTASRLTGVVDELAGMMGTQPEQSQMLLVVTDADGVVLWRAGPSKVRRRADSFGFCEGATWTEARVGTNAIGTALAEAAPVQLFSAEHFEQVQHPWYCTATPVHDPATGRLLGIIDVSGPAFTLHPAIAALVEATRRLAEARLLQRHQRDLESLRQSAAPVLASLSGPAIVLDDDGWFAASSGGAPARRLAAPRADRLLVVPGLGSCQAQPLAHGWLVQPVGQHAAPARLTLSVHGTPALSVEGAGDSWEHPLTPRHADILLLLHAAGAAGLSAAELSAALYGDRDHVVTVRAEMSRLRRSLGALVEGNPYRLAAGTTLTLACSGASCDCLRTR